MSEKFNDATEAGSKMQSGTWTAVLMLIVACLVTFANGAPDALVFDDKAFVGPDAEQRLEQFQDAFTRDVWNASGNQGGLYRPLLMLNFDLENRLFGPWKRGYHLVNILLHLATTLVLFGFLRFLLRSVDARAGFATLAALVAALVFAVHPIHAEVVNSVFNRSSMYVTGLSLMGLWWLLSRLDDRPASAWFGLALCFSLAILFKESALVLPGIAFAFVFLLGPGPFWQRVRRGLPVFWLLIPLALYFWARAQALDDSAVPATIADSDDFIALFANVLMAGDQSWLAGFGLYGQGLRMLVWPYPLQLYHPFPGQAAILAYSLLQAGLAFSAWLLWRRGRPALALGLAFYYLALLPSIRILSLDGTYPHIAERYLYFPSVGLALVLAFGGRALAGRFTARALTAPALLLVLVMAGMSWNRNHEWGNELLLFETEYARGHRGAHALRLLVVKHRMAGRLDRVVQICEENSQRYGEIPRFVNSCALTLVKLGRAEDAIAALEAAVGNEENWIDARVSLAQVYLAQGERQKAADQFVAIVNGVAEPDQKLYFQAELLLHLYGRNRQRLQQAQALYRDALRINPELQIAQQRLEEVATVLQSLEPAD